MKNLILLMVSKKKENYPPRVNLKSKSSNKLKNSKLNSLRTLKLPKQKGV